MKVKMVMGKEVNEERIVNKLDESSNIYWIDTFVEKVLKESHISYDEAIIDSLESGKRIFLIIDGIKYTIRTWDFIVREFDINNRPCKATINYTLFKQVEQVYYNKVVFEGSLDIEMKSI